MTTAPTTATSETTLDSRRAEADILQQPTSTDHTLLSSTPVEMSSLEAPQSAPAEPHNPLTPTETAKDDPASPAAPHGPSRMDTASAISASLHPPPSPPAGVSQPRSNRAFSTAIGPSSDTPLASTKEEPASGPTLLITLLLTNGARHPFKLDHKYLAKRGVEIAENDPFNLSVYKLKELILREWREEWEAKPTSPNYIRLISFGKLLDDKAELKDYKFNAETPNVLHMTIKPQDFVEEEDTKGGKGTYGNNRESEQRSPGCRCVLM